ncbi:IniB N-terminal domain-containing protein [Pseudonocardia sp. CA-142604]|uniref:IniB N-terminal domain-containing protein n=1 Tax=Pseudonocardia sp. CA-142604 TaxID=3240024 RepID=UPI003D8ECB5A
MTIPEVAVPQPLSLLDFLRGLQTDADFRSAFTADPEATIVEHGLDGLSPDDIHDALVLVEDNETADFDHDYAAATGAVHPAPPPAEGEDGPAAQYLSEYLASVFPGADAPVADGWSTADPDLDFDLGPFASGNTPGATHDGIGFGEGADGLAADVDLDADPGSGPEVGDQFAGQFSDAFGGGAETFDGPAFDDDGPDDVTEPHHAAPDEPHHPID